MIPLREVGTSKHKFEFAFPEAPAFSAPCRSSKPITGTHNSIGKLSRAITVSVIHLWSCSPKHNAARNHNTRPSSRDADHTSLPSPFQTEPFLTIIFGTIRRQCVCRGTWETC